MAASISNSAATPLRTDGPLPPWPSEKEHQRDEEQKQNAHEPEHAQETQQGRLLSHRPVEHGLGAATRGDGVGAASQEQHLSPFQRLPSEGANVRYVRGQQRLIELRAPQPAGLLRGFGAKPNCVG